MSDETVGIQIPLRLFLRLADYEARRGNSESVFAAVVGAIENHIGEENAQASQNNFNTMSEYSDGDRPFAWKNLLLPEGTNFQMQYKGRLYRAAIEKGRMIADGKETTPGEFVRLVTNTNRNAWRDIWIRRPTDTTWRLADDLRRTSSYSGEGGRLPQGGSDGPGSVQHQDSTWRDDVELTLYRLGGKARLENIYTMAEGIRSAAGKPIPRTLDAIVRRTLEENCSDTDSYKGRSDIFCMPDGKGAGVWGLRSLLAPDGTSGTDGTA